MPAKSPDTSDPIGTVVGIAELSARILGQMAREPDRAPTLAEVYAQQVRLMLGDADLSPAPTAETLHQPLYHALQPLLPCQYALPPALAETHRAVCAQLASDQPNKYHRHSGLLLSGPRGTGKSEYASVLKGALGDSIGAYVLDLAKVANSPRPAEALVSVYEALQAEAERTGRYVVLQIDEFDICVREYASMESTSELHETARESGTTRHERTSSKTTIDQVGAQLFATLKSCISGDGRFGRVYTVPTTNLDVSKIPDTLTRDGRCLHVPMVHPFVHLRGQDSRLGLSDGKYQAHLSHPSHLAYALEIFAATHCRMRGLDQRPEGFETLIVEARGLVRRFAEMKPM